MSLKFVKLSENAFTPTKGSEYAAGLDLYSVQNCTILPNERAIVPTDLQFEFPPDCYGRIATRSSVALKGIDVVGGVVDTDYRGNVGVILHNSSIAPFHVSRGERIAQIICEKICYPKLQEVSALSDTARSSSGLGMSAKQHQEAPSRVEFAKQTLATSVEQMNSTWSLILEQAYALVKTRFESEKDLAHNWRHIQKVVNNALNLCDAEKVDADTRALVHFAALFHEYFDTKVTKDLSVAESTFDACFQNDVELGQRVKHVAKNVSWRVQQSNGANDQPCLALKIVRDADRLEATGTVGIARCLLYAGYHHEPIEKAVEHLRQKVLALTWYTDTARDLAEVKYSIVKKYVADFDARTV